MSSQDAQMALARAAMDPNSALDAVPLVDREQVQLEVVAGVPAPERLKGLTLAVEVEPPHEFSRWRFFIFYCLIKLAAWVYRFEFEMYRTREPWEK